MRKQRSSGAAPPPACEPPAYQCAGVIAVTLKRIWAASPLLNSSSRSCPAGNTNSTTLCGVVQPGLPPKSAVGSDGPPCATSIHNGALNVVYFVLLARAYHLADMSLAYPLMLGCSSALPAQPPICSDRAYSAASISRPEFSTSVPSRLTT